AAAGDRARSRGHRARGAPVLAARGCALRAGRAVLGPASFSVRGSARRRAGGGFRPVVSPQPGDGVPARRRRAPRRALPRLRSLRFRPHRRRRPAFQPGAQRAGAGWCGSRCRSPRSRGRRSRARRCPARRSPDARRREIRRELQRRARHRPRQSSGLRPLYARALATLFGGRCRRVCAHAGRGSPLRAAAGCGLKSRFSLADPRSIRMSNATHLARLMRLIAGDRAASDILDTLHIERAILLEGAGEVTRGAFAMALNALLFQDLLDRVPTGAAYVADRRRLQQRITFDHGALRTVRLGRGPTGALPGGIESFARILQPLGYHQAGVYPLDALRMTGHAFAHRDYPESLPQFFVSELHVERFSADFQAAAQRVFGSSRDPLTPAGRAALDAFAARGRCAFDTAALALREI